MSSCRSLLFSSRSRRRSPFHELLHAQALADHGAHDAEELRLLVVVALLVVGEGHPERPHRLGVDLDRDADEGQLLFLAPAGLREDPAAIQEERLAAHPRHHHRPPALHHAAGDALTHAIADLARVLGRGAGRGLDHQIAGVLVLQDHAAGNRPVALLQDLEHPGQGGLEVQGRPEGLADLEQIGELADLGGGGSASHRGGSGAFRKGQILQIWRAEVKRGQFGRSPAVSGRDGPQVRGEANPKPARRAQAAQVARAPGVPARLVPIAFMKAWAMKA